MWLSSFYVSLNFSKTWTIYHGESGKPTTKKNGIGTTMNENEQGLIVTNAVNFINN
jgi:hypothetical protein